MNNKMTPHQHQQMLKNQIFNSYNQPAPLQKSEENKPLEEVKGTVKETEEGNPEGTKVDESAAAE